MYTIFTLYVHYTYTICTLYVHYMYTIRTLYVHYMYTICNYMYTICTLYIHYTYTMAIHMHVQSVIVHHCKIPLTDLPMCVRFSNAPAAFLCTLESATLVSLSRGGMAPCRAISLLLDSVVARVVIHPHELHWTSGSSLPRRVMRECRAPA